VNPDKILWKEAAIMSKKANETLQVPKFKGAKVVKVAKPLVYEKRLNTSRQDKSLWLTEANCSVNYQVSDSYSINDS
jgi:hypothetical protein